MQVFKKEKEYYKTTHLLTHAFTIDFIKNIKFDLKLGQPWQINPENISPEN